MRRRRALLHTPLAMCVLTLMTFARAGSASTAAEEPIVLTYAAEGADCPGAAEFIRGVRSYTTNWKIVPEGTPRARTIDVRIAGTESEAHGTLTANGPEEQPSARTLTGPSCAAISEALAVMVAVAIDPNANESTQDITPPPPVASSVPAAAAGAPPSTPPVERASRTRVSIDLRGEVTSAVVGKALFDLALSLDIEPPFGGMNGRFGPFRPSFGLGFRQSLPRSNTTRGGSVTFLWSAAELRLCPLRFALFGARIEVATCAESNLGALQARAHEFAEARDVTLFWADIGGSAWIKTALNARWFVDATFLTVAPLTRRSVELASGTVVARTPTLGLLGGIGVGARF